MPRHARTSMLYLAAGLCFLPASALAAPPAGPTRAAQTADLVKELEALDEESRPAVVALFRKLTGADADAGYNALREAWPTLRSSDVRIQALLAFANARPDVLGTNARDRLHPALVDVLNLGARDPHAGVQSQALRLLRQIAFKDFADDYGLYEPWFKQHAGQDANEVLIASVEAFVKDAAPKRGDDARQVVDFLDENAALLNEFGAARAAAIQAGYARLLRDWLTSDQVTMQAAMRLSGRIQLGEAEMRDTILPLIKAPHSAPLRAWAIASLGDAKATWAIDDLLAVLDAARGDPDELRSVLSPMARALGAMGEARAIPALIAAMEAEGSPAGAGVVGAQGLSPLTGVRQVEGRDAKWWRGWWERNRARYGPAAEAIAVPPRAEPAAAEPDAGAEDVADVPSLSVTADYDNNKRYNLIGLGKDAPAGGYKVLLVLPGGDGGPAYRDFVRRIHKFVLGSEWLTAQLIAPRWDPQQAAENVWPNRLNPAESAAFTTETFIDDVLADLKDRAKINEAQVYALAWSSGGPALYSAMLKEGSPIKGAMIAMSVMPRATPEDLAQAKGRRFWLYQSPDDDRTPMKQAEDAAVLLRRNGALVDLQSYPGGHAWTGDVYPALKRGVEWVTKP